MKRLVWLTLAVTLVAVGPLSAQTPYPDTQTPPATPQQLQAGAGTPATINPITGTVVSIDGDTLVLDTDNGEITYTLAAGVTAPAGLTAGDRVQLTAGGTTGTSRTVTTITRLDTTGTATTTSTTTLDEDMDVDVDTDNDLVEPDVDTETTTTVSPASPGSAELDRSTDTGATIDDELPQTATQLPALGLLGLFALAGGLALGLRRRRS